MTNVMAEVRIAKKNLMPKQWSFGQCCRINGEQSNQWLFEALWTKGKKKKQCVNDAVIYVYF